MMKCIKDNYIEAIKNIVRNKDTSNEILIDSLYKLGSELGKCILGQYFVKEKKICTPMNVEFSGNYIEDKNVVVISTKDDYEYFGNGVASVFPTILRGYIDFNGVRGEVFLPPRNDRKLLYLTVTKLLVIMTKTNEKEKEIITAQSFDEHKLVITSFVAKSHGYYNKLRAVCQSQRKNYLSES